MSAAAEKAPALKDMDRAVLMTIAVAALGYFVDIFDLLLFSIVRVQSLKDLGVAEDAIMSTGITLINAQMAGLLLGGILWGIWGDKLGRVSVLFGSILLYSAANIANGFVQSVEIYALLRFIAGVGLAGELGAGVTLASELLPRQWRGLGTAFIAMIGLFGAVAAALIADLTDWRTAYITGGVMGLALLVMRVNVRESALYQKIGGRAQGVSRGNILMILGSWQRLRRYLAVILVGAPIWGVVGLFITFTPEFAKDFDMYFMPKAGTAVLFCYAGGAFGDMASGILSQILKSRRKAVAVFLGMMGLFTALYVNAHEPSLFEYYTLCTLLGFSVGYWAMFVQMGAEQFGTNIRATAATTVPNVVRGLTIPMTMSFHALTPALGVTAAGAAVVGGLIVLAFICLITLKETFHDDLDYLES